MLREYPNIFKGERLVDNVWTKDTAENLGTLDPYGVGCFLLKKE
jgi:hypothetical protein